MRQITSQTSLLTQILVVCGSSALITAIAAVVSIAGAAQDGGGNPQTGLFLQWRIAIAVGLASVVGLTLMMLAINRVIQSLRDLREGMKRVIGGELENRPSRPPVSSDIGQLQQTFDKMVSRLRDAREENDSIQQALTARKRTVDRLLDFSQTIQGAGKSEQVYSTLCHFLQSELSLASVTILCHEADATPATQVKASLPAECCTAAVGEMDGALCPCLRQSQPRCFRTDSPVRCSVDQFLKDPANKPAYCVPFTVGRKLQFMVHMLLLAGEAWSEERRQLAQTYVNTAQSSLTSLHLLAEAEQESMTDALTGLYNRRSMDQLLEREVALCERHGRPLTIFMVDMDLFKQVNDAHGHAAGDYLLKTFADCVRITLRKTDLAFRYGGDEFCIALPTTPLSQAQQVVQKLRQAFAAVDFTSAIAHMDHQPTLSIGIAERSQAQNVLTLTALLGAADQALYEAKNANRNCVKTYAPPQAA
ncbi:MAG TPA: diguanylate cyclase [Tepidisphaeraceae bacterium]|nr:diguanylate cyclase [Tepidisphaeraceae bacterium]